MRPLPVLPDVGGAVVEDEVDLKRLYVFLDSSFALFRSDVLLQADDIWERRDLDDVDTDNHRGGRASL